MFLVSCNQAPGAHRTTPTLASTLAPLRACPATSARAAPQVLLKNLKGPDDLGFDDAGRLLFTQNTAGTLSALNPDGSVERIAAGLSGPEGVVVEADGRILVAEQGRNRIDAVDPRSHGISVWRSFPNHTASEGIDGIGPVLPDRDSTGQPLPDGGDVVIPDSPNGVVWKVTPDGSTATQIASGMTRPVGAGIDSHRRILVVDEAGPVWRLDQGKQRLGSLPTPDDVVVAARDQIFVNTLGDNAIHQLDADGRQVATISGLRQPQGIALDTAGNLYLTEFDAGTIDRVVRTFILDPARVTRLGNYTFIVCPAIRRASGFVAPLELTTGSSPTTSIVAVIQPGIDSSGAVEIQTTDPSVSITVSADVGGRVGLSQLIPLTR